MKVFGLDISVKKSENKYLPKILNKWQYGREYANRYDVNSQIEAYKSWVYVCVKRNSTTFASFPLRLYAAIPGKGYKPKCMTRIVDKNQRKYLDTLPGLQKLDCVRKAVNIEEVLDHRFLDIMKNMNPFRNRFDILELTNCYQDLSGDCYWYMVKDRAGLPIEFWMLPSQNVKIQPDPEKFIKGYRYSRGIEYIDFEENEILHFMYPNPKDPYLGMSPLMAAAGMYNIMENMNQYENALFTNNARLEGYWHAEQPIDDRNFERISKELEGYRGVERSGMTPLLEGIKYETLNLPPKELAFLKGREWTQKEIYAVFDNFVQLDDPDTNRANAETADYKYMRYGIYHRHRRFEEKLNEKLLPLYDEKIFCAFDNCIPEDKDFDVKKNVEYVKNGILLRNEIRQEMGKDPYEGGDTPIVPGGGFGTLALNQENESEKIERFTGKIAELVKERIGNQFGEKIYYIDKTNPEIKINVTTPDIQYSPSDINITTPDIKMPEINVKVDSPVINVESQKVKKMKKIPVRDKETGLITEIIEVEDGQE